MGNNSSNQSDDLSSVFGEVISKYTREQAIADGELVDISGTATEAGFRFPCAVTRALWETIERIPKKTPWQDKDGRLWDCLWMAKDAIRRAKPGVSRVAYQVILSTEGSPSKYQTLVIDLGPGDDAAPVFTMGFPSDF
jgi:hypothetical protein